MAQAKDKQSFKDSQEAAFRRIVRGAVRKADFTKSERDVTLAVVNFWFHHKNRREPIHPGRQKLAKRAGVTVKTVSRTLDMLRAAGVLIPVSNLKGGFGTATKYTVETRPLMTLCGCDWVDEFMRGAAFNVPVDHCEMSRLRRDKMSHGIYSVKHSPSQNSSEAAPDE